METKKVALLLTAFVNAVTEAGEKLAEGLEELNSSEGEDEGGSKNKRDRSSGKRGKKDDDGPTEDDVVDAVRAAQKVLESADIKKILKKQGKADRASEVEEEHRQAVIDALEKAIEDAD